MKNINILLLISIASGICTRSNSQSVSALKTIVVANNDSVIYSKLNSMDVLKYIDHPAKIFLDSLGYKYEQVFPLMKKPKAVDRLIFYYSDSISMIIKAKDFIQKSLFTNMKEFDLDGYLNSRILILRFFYAGKCFKGCRGYSEETWYTD